MTHQQAAGNPDGSDGAPTWRGIAIYHILMNSRDPFVVVTEGNSF